MKSLLETHFFSACHHNACFEGDFDLSSFKIDRHPRLSIAKVINTEMGMPMIEYSPITGGEETFTYSICDGISRCDTCLLYTSPSPRD